MTMLTMRCRVLQNELIEGQQEQQTVTARIASLQHVLQLQMAEKDRCAQRYAWVQCLHQPALGMIKRSKCW